MNMLLRDSECAGDLVCGKDNCRSNQSWSNHDDDDLDYDDNDYEDYGDNCDPFSGSFIKGRKELLIAAQNLVSQNSPLDLLGTHCQFRRPLGTPSLKKIPLFETFSPILTHNILSTFILIHP